MSDTIDGNQMIGFQDSWAARQRRRWMRPNAHLYIRHDAWRFMPAGSPRYVGRDVVRYSWPETAKHSTNYVARKFGALPEQDAGAAWEKQYAITRERWHIAALRFQLALLRLA